MDHSPAGTATTSRATGIVDNSRAKRPREACTNCRNVKTKCHPSDPSLPTSKDRCIRCTKYGLPCDYARKRRGRRPGGPARLASGASAVSGPRASEERDDAAALGSEHSMGLQEEDEDDLVGISFMGGVDMDRDRGSNEFILPNNDNNNPANDHQPYFAAPLPPPHPPLPHRLSSLSYSIQSSSRPHHQSHSPSTEIVTIREPHIGIDDTQPVSPRRSDLHHLPPGIPLSRSSNEIFQPSLASGTGRLSGAGAAISPAGAAFTQSPNDASSTISEGWYEGWLRWGKNGTVDLSASGPQMWAGSGARREEVRLHGPIELGLLTEIEAESLYKHFMSHLCPLSSLLDPAYHTFSRLRSFPPTLLTSLLAVTSRFHPLLSSLYPQLHSHAETLINRVTNSGLIDLQTVQALLILVLWKKPSDRSAYVKVGLAIRGAYQLGLAKRRVGPLPGDEEEARNILDQERTWLSLLCSDGAYSHIFQLPMMIQDRSTADAHRRWVEEHAWMGIPGDAHLAFSLGLFPDLDEMPVRQGAGKVNIQSTNLPQHDPNESLSWRLTMTERRLVRHLQSWTSSGLLTGIHLAMAGIVTASTLCNLKSHQFQVSPSDATRSALVIGAEEAADSIATAARAGLLVFWSDMVSSGISTPGIVLYHARAHLTHHELSRALEIVRNVSLTCATLMEAYTDHALFYVSRFYRRLERVFEKLIHSGRQAAEPEPNSALLENFLWHGLGFFPQNDLFEDLVSWNQFWNDGQAMNTGEGVAGGSAVG